MNQLAPQVVEWRRTLRADGRLEVVGRWPSRRRTLLVVDDDGLWVRGGDLRIPWSHLVSAEVLRVRGVSMLLLGVTEEFHALWLDGHGWFVRAMWIVERISRSGQPRLRVPGRLAVDLEVFADWLEREIENRGDRSQA